MRQNYSLRIQKKKANKSADVLSTKGSFQKTVEMLGRLKCPSYTINIFIRI
jgi:hypothetical protein